MYGLSENKNALRNMKLRRVLPKLTALGTIFYATSFAAHAQGERQVISLDGVWDIADSVSPTGKPRTFIHKAPVPGLVHSSTPAFEAVDLFDSNLRLEIQGQIPTDMAPPMRRLPSYQRKTKAGISYQKRDYFWYRTYFNAPGKRANAILKVNKAQYGAEVWVNGHKVGGHLGCATAAYYDIDKAVRWSARNEVLIRIGAHPGAIPDGNSCGFDPENYLWTPGIYDSVSVSVSDNPRIETIQVAPRLDKSQIIVQTKLKNDSDRSVFFELVQVVHEWRGTERIAQQSQTILLAAGEEQTITQSISLLKAKRWTPETPDLYVVETKTGGDSTSTRFGMREFRCDTPTRRCYLNGQPYFMRGSDIAINRFFDDPLSARLPWDEAWVRKLLITIPKQMHWNSLRSFAGALPEKWLDIADEAGLLIQYEYPIWSYDGVQRSMRAEPLIAEYSAWIRDHWNHPSIVIWDACNECIFPLLGEKIIPGIRDLDLSNRPWENSWNGAVGANDPVEVHPYKFQFNAITEEMMRAFELPIRGDFDMTELETLDGGAHDTGPSTGHALINNEFEWLWLNRDGSPTLLTKKVYSKLPYPRNTAEERFETSAYLLAGMTEYWRAYRNLSGVLHYAYLLSSHPGAATSDNFRDVKELKLDPYFESYVGEAFKPLGIYINFWQRTMRVGAKKRMQVMKVNDDGETRRGNLRLVLEDMSGTVVAEQKKPYALAAHGQQTYLMDFEAPDELGKFWLKAIATPLAGNGLEPTVSRRHLEIVTGNGGNDAANSVAK